MHTIKFFIDPEIASVQNNYIELLKSLIASCNITLARNTQRRFIFDSVTVLPKAGQLIGDGVTLSNASLIDYPLRIHIHNTTQGLGSPYGDNDSSGDGVIEKIQGPLYFFNDPNIWKTVSIILHEFAHLCGAGFGELYNIRRMIAPDGTDLAPAYFTIRPDMLKDPLIGYYGSDMKYSDLTAKIIAGNYRFKVKGSKLAQIKIDGNIVASPEGTWAAYLVNGKYIPITVFDLQEAGLDGRDFFEIKSDVIFEQASFSADRKELFLFVNPPKVPGIIQFGAHQQIVTTKGLQCIRLPISYRPGMK
jgi:hypothetical protein